MQTAGGNVAQLVRNFPNLHWVGEIDGSDPIESYGILKEAVDYCRYYAAEARRRLSRPGPFQDWVDRSTLREELDGYLAGRRAIGLQVWRWLSLEAWSQAFVARDPRVLARETPEVLTAGRHVDYEEAERMHDRALAAG